MSSLLPQVQSLTSDSGVYLFLDEKSKIIYIGKAKNLRKRVASYFQNKDLGPKTAQLVSRISDIKIIPVTSEVEAFLLEEKLIKKYHPKFNISLKDAKTYPYVEINIKDQYPSVVLTRRVENKKAKYFGPYVNVSSLRGVLKMLRRIFPYVSVKNHPKYICFYNHLGLCPCPNVTGDVYYKKDIKYIINFLEGKTSVILRDLQKERDEYSKKELFEKAAETQNKINSVKIVTSPFYKPTEYESNPDFKSDVIFREVNSLKEILNNNNVKVDNLKRIECYDISNTQGKLATSSMVVFSKGEKDSSSYRRFKIRDFYNNKPNDFAMIKETLTRRLKHNEWQFPDLIIIDGGKGQVSSAKKVLKEKNLHIPLIGLAKKEEIIITADLKEIKIPKNSDALRLVMRIRDEAHRFAIAYHKKLRSKFIFE